MIKIKFPRKLSAFFILSVPLVFTGILGVCQVQAKVVTVLEKDDDTAYFPGYVGIGTTGPGAKLDIFGTNNGLKLTYNSGNYASISVGSTGYTSFSATGIGSGFAFDKQINANYTGNSIRVAGDIYFNNGSKGLTNASGDLKIFPAGNTIFTSGNVGIGTNGPVGKLNVVAAAESVVPASGSNSAFLNITGSGYGLIAGVLGNGKTYLQSQRIDETPTVYDMLIQPNGGNVGIGTTTPGSVLYIASNSSAPEIVIHNTGGNGGSGFRFIDNLSSSDFRFKAVTTGGFKIRDNTYSMDVLQIENNSAANALYIKSGGNVGIGTTNPQYKLAVSGGTASYFDQPVFVGSPSVDSNAATKGYVDSIAFSSYWTLNSNSLYASSTSWDVGIGTTNPGNKLTIVNEETTSVAPIQITSYYASASTPQGQIVNFIARGTAASPSAIQTNDIMGGFRARGYGTSRFSLARVGINGYAAENWTDSSQGTYISFMTTPIGSSTISEKVRITGDGNVGIGTTTPANNLQIGDSSSSFTPTASPISLSLGNTYSSQAGLHAKLKLFDMGQATSDYGLGVSSNKMDFMVPGDAGYAWYIGGANNMVLSSGGNVGIGTTTPSYKLAVTGDVGAVSFVYTSDRSLKKNIETLNDSLEKIMKLRGVSFNWKEDNNPGIGLIAQEVEEVFPELVSDGNGTKGIQYGNLVAPLIEAVKTQQQEIEAQKLIIEEQQAKIKNINARLRALEIKK